MTPLMSPAAGERLLRYVGDRVRFHLRGDGVDQPGWTALLRTNLGRADRVHDEIVAALHRPGGSGDSFAGGSWRDIPLRRDGDGWSIDLPMTEVGFFHAKPYALSADGAQHWPDGGDIGLCVHHSAYRTGNTIYCAFPRMFGATRVSAATRQPLIDEQLAVLDRHGYTVIPPSGTLRDLTAQVPHIVDTLGCRILHLLPVNATPTTHARFGRFGSPYACQDLTAIDPALAVFDQRTTVVDQFRELTYACHLRRARVFLDIVINHTGWGSTLLNEHPEWFKRRDDGRFHSPGAWGTTWEDLVELDHRFPDLWAVIADSLLVWCRRGVDGFRCDAGYMVPMPAWRYITARVRREFPATLFLLEGLGGSWDASEGLLTDGGMQWAYSELFQNHSGPEVAGYADHAIAAQRRVGVLVNYSETHDNDRLAKGGRAWSLLRNRLCALTSVGGAYGFTCGVEWLATEKLDVHHSRGLNWGAADHLVDELAALTRLVGDHPCFLDGAALRRLSADDSPVLALARDSAAGDDHVLVLVNTDIHAERAIGLPADEWRALGGPSRDLLGQDPPGVQVGDDHVSLVIPAAGCFCLGTGAAPNGLAGDAYRRARDQVAWAYDVLRRILAIEDIGPAPWRDLAAWVAESPVRFLAAVGQVDPMAARADLFAALRQAGAGGAMPPVVAWIMADVGRVVPVPPGHWLLVRDASPFFATLDARDGTRAHRQRSVTMDDGHVVCFAPDHAALRVGIMIERFAEEGGRQVVGELRRLGATAHGIAHAPRPADDPTTPLALLTNGIGGMARMAGDFGRISSKYDCLLGANLHVSAPCDRHVLAKRLRAWVNADGFITPLDGANLARFEAGPPARWVFVANAGDGRTVQIDVEADMIPGRNCTTVRFARHGGEPLWGADLPLSCRVRLSLRVDIEDRSFHGETHRDAASEAHFRDHVQTSAGRAGFVFAPATDRVLRAWIDRGSYRPDGEWSEDIPHPVEASRGMAASGDAYSPGWFDVPLGRGDAARLVVCADADDPTGDELNGAADARAQDDVRTIAAAGLGANDGFGRRLALALRAFVVRRGEGRTVIAGYPWFLDWGRDTFISARGLLAAGLGGDVRRILVTFARFEDGGTLPNLLNGDDAANRDTSDAPLWFGIACEDAAAALGAGLYATPVPPGGAHGAGRVLGDVLRSIAIGYLRGTANGIRVDPASALVWSPAHFTWMDTNHPACTPRQGYPIEIQVLWIRLLRQLERIAAPIAEGDRAEPWRAIAERALASLERFWLEDRGHLADLLIADPGVPADRAVVDNALRSNGLFAVSLGVIDGERARRVVAAACRYLVVPGALRSLAPLPVDPPLVNASAAGQLLNDPRHPYWGRYEGDEDTRRKPAYHNGTAWTWTFPTFCEALARAWDFAPDAVAAARAYLGSMDELLDGGAVGHIPEIIDGDAPHARRGCDAQAWGVTEALRVWKLLG